MNKCIKLPDMILIWPKEFTTQRTSHVRHSNSVWSRRLTEGHCLYKGVYVVVCALQQGVSPWQSLLNDQCTITEESQSDTGHKNTTYNKGFKERKKEYGFHCFNQNPWNAFIRQNHSVNFKHNAKNNCHNSAQRQTRLSAHIKCYRSIGVLRSLCCLVEKLETLWEKWKMFIKYNQWNHLKIKILTFIMKCYLIILILSWVMV